MNLPFSTDAFYEVFGQYNRALWPAVAIAWLSAAIVTLALLLKKAPDRRLDLAATALLGALWSWSGAVYHAMYFTAINPAAWIFAASFLVEAGLLVRSGLVLRDLSFGAVSGTARIAGLALALYALAYPGLSIALGHPYPDTPTFGVPCPTTIATVGLLLTCTRPPVSVALVPAAWSVVGGSASLLLEAPADYVLLACGPALAMKVWLGDGRARVEWRTS